MKGYFYGWYLKQLSSEGILAVIPSVSINGAGIIGNIQIITQDDTFNFSNNTAAVDEKHGVIIVGKSVFTLSGFSLDIDEEHVIKGGVKFADLTPLPRDIMGPFSLLGGMECAHMIKSMRHQVYGQVTIDGREYLFNGQSGYFEGDRGKSFPKSYIWTQGMSDRACVMMAAGKIPVKKSSFTGVICAVLLNDKIHRFATYNGARLISADDGHICVRRGETELCAYVEKAAPRPLKAPVDGELRRTIYESPVCRVRFTLKTRGCVLMDFTDDNAGFERA